MVRHFAQRDNKPGREIYFTELDSAPEQAEWTMSRERRLENLRSDYIDSATREDYADDYYLKVEALPDSSIIYGQCSYTAGAYIAVTGHDWSDL